MTDAANPAMEELVEKGGLKRADILLTRTKCSLLKRPEAKSQPTKKPPSPSLPFLYCNPKR